MRLNFVNISVVHSIWFKCDSRVVRDCDVTIRGLIVVRGFKSHLKFERIASSSSIFGHAREIFLFFVTVESPCRLVMCERTSDYSHMFITVTTCQLQLQRLLNRHVNNAFEVIVHPAYSPDLWLFLTLKHDLRGWFLESNEVIHEIQKSLTRILEAKFHKMIEEKWVERLKQCFASPGKILRKRW